MRCHLKLPIIFLLLAGLLGGCAKTSQEIWGELRARGAGSGFQALTLEVPPFALSALLKMPEKGADSLVVYIEGDGRILNRQGRVRNDPSPGAALVFDLALMDPAPAVLYLTRLGHYQPRYAGEAYKTYWSDGRLAPETVQATNAAIDQVKARLGVSQIYLIGYSGGGGMASLAAARRDDVAGLVTVAALLDHVWWTAVNDYQPLSKSLNPIDYAEMLEYIPQIHFYGTEDTLITPEMSLRFSQAAPFTSTRLQRVGVKADHSQGWREAWPGLLEKYIICLLYTSEAETVSRTMPHASI